MATPLSFHDLRLSAYSLENHIVAATFGGLLGGDVLKGWMRELMGLFGAFSNRYENEDLGLRVEG